MGVSESKQTEYIDQLEKLVQALQKCATPTEIVVLENYMSFVESARSKIKALEVCGYEMQPVARSMLLAILISLFQTGKNNSMYATSFSQLAELMRDQEKDRISQLERDWPQILDLLERTPLPQFRDLLSQGDETKSDI